MGPGVLSHVLSKLPKCKPDPDLLIGFDSADDAAVYRVSDEIAVVQTVDFFPPMVEDPYTFGKIAATNALSDVYAMGGEVKTAMNIVCFPQSWDINMLGEILRGGSEKVIEAGGVLVGGHSINDVDVKYGLSVMGLVHPDKIYANNGGHPGDKLIITKQLGVGIISTAHRVGEATQEAMDKAIDSMTTLNKYAAQCCKKYDIHGCTDITGFGFLGHLHEMVDGKLSCRVYADKLPVFPEALEYADEFLLTARTLCDKTGTVRIMDEVQSGYGRSGKFFAHQWSGVKADIVSMAKGIANGFPVGAIIISPSIPAKKGMLGTTFGGSHLACAAAIAVADVIKDEALVENARLMGDKIIEGIRGTSGIKDIRGRGLMIGIDLSVPQTEFRKVLREKYHIMTGLTGQFTLRLLPPLVIGEKEVDRFVEAFRATAAELGM